MNYIKFFIFYILILFIGNARAHESEVTIVVLHSYNQENNWTRLIDSSFKENLRLKKGRGIRIFTEFIDSKRFFGPQFDLQLSKLLLNKFRGMHIDLVVTSDDYAFTYALNFRQKIFNNAPVIFSGVNGFEETKKKFEKAISNSTGILEVLDIDRNIKLAFRLHPKAKKIYIINTKYTPTGRYLKAQFENALIPYIKNYQIEYLETYSFEELYELSRHFEKDSVVIFGAYSRDRLGEHTEFRQLINNLSKNSSRPIYGFNEIYIRYGLTGGYIVSGDTHGKAMAEMANKYLSGTSIRDIPVIVDSNNPLILDVNELERYNIDMSNIPTNAKLIRSKNKLYNFYYNFKRELWAVLISFTFLLICIISLYYLSVRQKIFKNNLIKINSILERKVTERTKQLIEQQTKLVNSARLASIGEMASGIAHEVNNPLAIIGLTANRIKQRTDNQVNFKQVDRITATVSRVSKVIKGLKHLSKDGEKSSFNNFLLVEAIEDVQSLCQEKFKEYDIQIEIEVTKDLYTYGSMVQVGQLLLNLLNNSFDELITFKGERWINVKAHRVFLEEKPSYVEISVTDSGKGIDKADHLKVMEPFYTTKAERRGAGLGLTACQRIVARHSGQFFLDTDCENTRFVIRLPDKTA